MDKIKLYYCKECGNEFKKWYGKCPSCKQFNTIIEVEDIYKSDSNKGNKAVDISNVKVEKLNEVTSINKSRTKTEISEFDRVLGGGLVEGSLTLIGGTPGVGKSTLTLEVCNNISQKSDLLYVSGEESSEQIKLRAERIIEDKICDNFLIANVKDIEQIKKIVVNNKIKYVVIDSIQTMSSSDNSGLSGSITQLKECTLKLMYFAKESKTTIIMIGHVTKDGEIAGPKLLEHMVDTVLYLDAEKNTNYRILRSKKNRYGKVGEVGIFEMTSKGITSVSNLDTLHLQGEKEGEGIAYSIIYEGDRPLIIEVQSLIVPVLFGYPKRVTQGYNLQRMNLLLGLIQKRLNFDFTNLDVYLNLSIYLQSNSYSLDLAVIASIVSSVNGNKISKTTLYLGEVSLTGEIKKVDRQYDKIKEAEKLGFKKVYCNIDEKDISEKLKVEIVSISNIVDILT